MAQLQQRPEEHIIEKEDVAVELPRWKRIAFYPVAGFFLLLGGLGAILPGLPATPFLLLASYFLVRCSPRLNQVLLNSRFFGPILTDWQVRGGVRNHVKIRAVVFVVLAVGLSVYLSGFNTLVSATIIGLAFIGILVIIRLPMARTHD